MKLAGMPLTLLGFPAESITNRQFASSDLASIDRVFLPEALGALLDEPPVETRQFIEDDNRSAIVPDPIATVDGREFYLSVKGVGSTVDPYSWRALDRAYAAELADDRDVRERLQRSRPEATDRIVSGELWLRGSPYGGQGIEHAKT
ncbi:MAG: hypothetical protein L3J81_01120, partial [Thermoplasmata archaeon]|nr:hypothetical protein [Thermoplasmata archaeon]